MKLYIYPYKDDKGVIESLENLKVSEKFEHIFSFIKQSKQIVDVENPNKDLLHIYSSKVLQMITSKEPGWEKMVPTAVAKEINKKGLFGHPCFISKEKP